MVKKKKKKEEREKKQLFYIPLLVTAHGTHQLSIHSHTHSPPPPTPLSRARTRSAEKALLRNYQYPTSHSHSILHHYQYDNDNPTHVEFGPSSPLSHSPVSSSAFSPSSSPLFLAAAVPFNRLNLLLPFPIQVLLPIDIGSTKATSKLPAPHPYNILGHWPSGKTTEEKNKKLTYLSPRTCPRR